MQDAEDGNRSILRPESSQRIVITLDLWNGFGQQSIPSERRVNTSNIEHRGNANYKCLMRENNLEFWIFDDLGESNNPHASGLRQAIRSRDTTPNWIKINPPRMKNPNTQAFGTKSSSDSELYIYSKRNFLARPIEREFECLIDEFCLIRSVLSIKCPASRYFEAEGVCQAEVLRFG
jgi:hypothetical protein